MSKKSDEIVGKKVWLRFSPPPYSAAALRLGCYWLYLDDGGKCGMNVGDFCAEEFERFFGKYRQFTVATPVTLYTALDEGHD